MKDDPIYYSVGALLYSPADKKNLAQYIISEKFGSDYSLALCLEDTINDNFVKEAEMQLISTINAIYKELQTDTAFYLPKIFIRVRNFKQISFLDKKLGDSNEIITGYIIPKFCIENADIYIEEILKLNSRHSHIKYFMPIYENNSIVNLKHRYDNLYSLKDKLDSVEKYVLNIRVGGNDLSHLFGFRRECNESIHQISPIANIFSDIITVYGMDYIISGPVFEYYSGTNWEAGLRKEINDDKLCGFTGKTVIHPNQIAIVNDEYKVTEKNYNDAFEILNWDVKTASFVSGNITRERMNEYKTHLNWAKKILYLAENYGVKI